MKPNVVAVLDVGKTNKKISLYDRRFEVQAEERTTLVPGERDGLEVEASDELLAWFRTALKKLAKDFEISAIAVTTHGATCALLAEDGSLAYPVISYTSEKGSEVQDAFYQTFGDRDELLRITCSPDLGFANVAKQMFYVKTRLPDVWANCRHALFYTSFLGHALTGNMGTEPTYLGNHTYLRDFHKKDWSQIALALGADKMFPAKCSSPWELLGAVKPDLAAECGLSEACPVAMGIHDSNANFLPYLAQSPGDFILNSTGTWCVAMRQSETPDLTDDQVAAKVFYNLDALARPLKTSIFPAGMEYDTFRGFTDLKDEGDLDAVREVVAQRALFVVPGVLPDAAPFPGATPRVVNGDDVRALPALDRDTGKPMTSLGQQYYAALDMSLALATRQALQRVGATQGTQIFIEGGFANNPSYCALLAALLPDCTIALTNMKEGTSFGAALTGWMLAEGLDLDAIGNEFTIETKQIPCQDFGDLAAYEEAFTGLLGQ